MTGRFANRKRWIILTAFAVDFATDAPCFAGASDGATDRAYGGSVRGRDRAAQTAKAHTQDDRLRRFPYRTPAQQRDEEL